MGFAETKDYSEEFLRRVQKQDFGDLDKIRKDRLLRVLIAYSQTNYFIDGAKKRGFEYEFLREYEKVLNRGIKDESLRIRMVFIPTLFDELIPRLEAGYGDIAAAGLTITPWRKEKVDFSTPYLPKVHEVIVHNRNVKDIHSLDDLAGRSVYVLSGSSFATHLQELSRRLVQKGKAPIDIVQADSILTTEDILELVNAGIVETSVCDDFVGHIWGGVLSDLVVRKDLKINEGGQIAWAVRKNAPNLLKNVNQFIEKHKKGSLLGNILFKRYYKNLELIKNPISENEREKLDSVKPIIGKYSRKYGFDWMKIAALAYQESELQNNKQSHAGAVGIMQIKPSTAADKSVNIKNVYDLENNIHAGVKYLAFVRQRYFSELKMPLTVQLDFSLAAYNAGPARINQLRQKTTKRGLDPDIWFDNVELIAAEEIGRETVRYVSNINMYYIAYRLYYGQKQDRERKMNEISGR